jgi:secondary thiamine-phosphate synthase enzyme
MMVITHRHQIETTGQGDARDVTKTVVGDITRSAVTSGIVTVGVIGSTAGVTTIEYEGGVVTDLGALFERLAPRNAEYRHHLRWGDDNGSSHVRAALVGPSITVPFDDRTLALGTWQQIDVLEFDTQARRREYIVQIIGE